MTREPLRYVQKFLRFVTGKKTENMHSAFEEVAKFVLQTVLRLMLCAAALRCGIESTNAARQDMVLQILYNAASIGTDENKNVFETFKCLSWLVKTTI